MSESQQCWCFSLFALNLENRWFVYNILIIFFRHYVLLHMHLYWNAPSMHSSRNFQIVIIIHAFYHQLKRLMLLMMCTHFVKFPCYVACLHVQWIKMRCKKFKFTFPWFARSQNLKGTNGLCYFISQYWDERMKK